MPDQNSSIVVSNDTAVVYVGHPRWFKKISMIVMTVVILSISFGVIYHPAHADDLDTTVNNFINGAKSLLAKIAPGVAAIAMLVLGIMYMGSSIPVVKEWKESNPKAFSNVMLGVGVVLLASAVSGILLNLNLG